MVYEIFDLTNVTNSSNILEFTQRTNNIVESSLGIFIIIMIAAVFFISLLKREVTPGKAFAATSWVVMLSSLALKYMNLLDGTAFWVCLLLPGIAIMLLFFGTSN